MNKIPTAEEFANEHNSYRLPRGVSYYKEFGEMMIEFAQLHVEAALKAASEQAKVWVDDDPQPFGGPFKGVVKESILNAYPKELIK